MANSYGQFTVWVSVSDILKSEPSCTSHKPRASFQRWQVWWGLVHWKYPHAATQSYVNQESKRFSFFQSWKTVESWNKELLLAAIYIWLWLSPCLQLPWLWSGWSLATPHRTADHDAESHFITYQHISLRVHGRCPQRRRKRQQRRDHHHHIIIVSCGHQTHFCQEEEETHVSFSPLLFSGWLSRGQRLRIL